MVWVKCKNEKLENTQTKKIGDSRFLGVLELKVTLRGYLISDNTGPTPIFEATYKCFLMDYLIQGSPGRVG